MTFITIIVFWLIGLVVSSFTLIPILIIFSFGIPVTRKLERMKMLKENNSIAKRYLISTTILLTVFSLTITAVFLFTGNGLIGFLVGVGIAFLSSLGKTGKNKNNISDYIEVNKERFTTNLEEVVTVIMQS